MEKKLLKILNRCSVYHIENDDSLLFESADVISFHWVPKKGRLYINDGFVKTLKNQYPDSNNAEFKETLKCALIDAYGFNIKELIYMNDDYDYSK